MVNFQFCFKFEKVFLNLVAIFLCAINELLPFKGISSFTENDLVVSEN